MRKMKHYYNKINLGPIFFPMSLLVIRHFEQAHLAGALFSLPLAKGTHLKGGGKSW